RLARHYDRVLASRRVFLSRITWPLMQLGIALFVIGLLIWILGLLPVNQTAAGVQVDTLGWGLIGNRGLLIYVNVLMLVGIFIFSFIMALQRGSAWTRSVQRIMTTLPVIGGAFKTLAIARF